MNIARPSDLRDILSAGNRHVPNAEAWHSIHWSPSTDPRAVPSLPEPRIIENLEPMYVGTMKRKNWPAVALQSMESRGMVWGVTPAALTPPGQEPPVLRLHPMHTRLLSDPNPAEHRDIWAFLLSELFNMAAFHQPPQLERVPLLPHIPFASFPSVGDFVRCRWNNPQDRPQFIEEGWTSEVLGGLLLHMLAASQPSTDFHAVWRVMSWAKPAAGARECRVDRPWIINPAHDGEQLNWQMSRTAKKKSRIWIIDSDLSCCLGRAIELALEFLFPSVDTRERLSVGPAVPAHDRSQLDRVVEEDSTPQTEIEPAKSPAASKALLRLQYHEMPAGMQRTARQLGYIYLTDDSMIAASKRDALLLKWLKARHAKDRTHITAIIGEPSSWKTHSQKLRAMGYSPDMLMRIYHKHMDNPK